MLKAILIASLALLANGGEFDDSIYCEEIKICPNFKQERVKDKELPENVSRWSAEPEIGRNRSWDGVVPEKYKLELSFLNLTHYNGSVDITFNLRWPTSRISINHGKINPEVDYRSVSIRKVCGKNTSLSPFHKSHTNGNRCIEKATFLEVNETLIFDLLGAMEGGQGVKYVISFSNFTGRAGNVAGTVGGKGLFVSNSEREGSLGYSAALCTMFQFRGARTAFPCFDDPALKATFELSIERPAHISVASNLESVETQEIGDDRKRDRFGVTPVISTYLFAFSLMENFTSESITIPGRKTRVEVFAPVGKMDRLRWMLNESIPVIQYMERITNFKFPLRRLGFLVPFPAPLSGMENFGLVTVEGRYMENYDSDAWPYLTLVHEIVHQWLGDTVTISDWKEFCIQEGLTAYFEWKISADHRKGSVAKNAKDMREKLEGVISYEAYTEREYKDMKDVPEWCFVRPPLFFHVVAKRYGFEALERLLAKLIEKRPFGTADIEDYDKALDEATGGPMNAMRGYIKGWFSQDGPVYLLISYTSNCIVIRQKVARMKGRPVKPPIARRFPLSIAVQTSNSLKISIDISVTALEERICDVGTIYMVDPDSVTITQKAYTAEAYKNILTWLAEGDSALSKDQQKAFLSDFCTVFLYDMLPIPDEPATTKSSDWLEVYGLARNSSSISSRSECGCCLTSPEVAPTCMMKWRQTCKWLRLSKIVGYINSTSPLVDMQEK